MIGHDSAPARPSSAWPLTDQPAQRLEAMIAQWGIPLRLKTLAPLCPERNTTKERPLMALNETTNREKRPMSSTRNPLHRPVQARACATSSSKTCIRSAPNLEGPTWSDRPSPAAATFPRAENLNPITAFEDRAHSPAQGDRRNAPAARLHDRQPQGCPRASTGSILVTRLMCARRGRIVTDGGLRDAPKSPRSGDRRLSQRPSAPTNLTLTRRSTSTCRSAAASCPSFP